MKSGYLPPQPAEDTVLHVCSRYWFYIYWLYTDAQYSCIDVLFAEVDTLYCTAVYCTLGYSV